MWIARSHHWHQRGLYLQKLVASHWEHCVDLKKRILQRKSENLFVKKSLELEGKIAARPHSLFVYLLFSYFLWNMDIYKREFFSLVSIVSLYRRAYCKEVCRFFTAEVTKLKSTSRTTKTKSLSYLNTELLENHTSSHGTYLYIA